MQVLVVGGTGPTGVPIIEGLLARGHEVTIYHRGTHEVEFSRPIGHIHGDPFSESSIASDLAGATYDLVVSTYGRLRHIAAAMAGRTAKFIGVTSGAAYLGYRTPQHSPVGLPCPIAEDFPTYQSKAVDSFGWSVAEVERQILEHHTAGDFDATIFRYPNIYGPRSHTNAIASIVRRALDGRRHIIVPGNGGRLRNRGFVDNMAHAVMLALEEPKASGQIYNICDERTLTLRELATRIGETMGHDWEIIGVAHPIVDELCRAYVSEPHHQLFDLSKAKVELGYRDVVPALEAVDRTTRWLIGNPPPIEDMFSGPNSGGIRKDPLAYDLEDRLVTLARGFDEQITAAIPSLGRDRQ